jgi:hypothetical protein
MQRASHLLVLVALLPGAVACSSTRIDATSHTTPPPVDARNDVAAPESGAETGPPTGDGAVVAPCGETDFDPAIEAAIRAYLSIPDGPISAKSPLGSTYRDIDVLQVAGAASVAGIQCLTSLKTLRLSRGEASDLSLFRHLTSLEMLEISVHPVSDISPLSSLVRLTSLSLTTAPVSDLTPLQPLSLLESVNLSVTQVSDLSPISGKPVGFLDVSSSLVASLEPLRDMTTLRELRISNTRVTDLSPIAFPPAAGWRCNQILARDTPLDRNSIETVMPALCELGWAVTSNSPEDSTVRAGCGVLCSI